MAFKMGVSPSIPIKNNSFREGTYKTTTVAAGGYSSTTTLNVAAIAPELRQILRTGDYIQIGPSTTSGNIGKSEYAIVNTPTSTTAISLQSALAYDYSEGDDVTFIGSRLAGGWSLSSNDKAVLQPDGLFYWADQSGTTKWWGFSDNFAQKMIYYNNASWVRQTLGDVIIPNQVYRVGCFVMGNASVSMWGGSPTSSDKFRMQMSDGSTTTNYEIKNGTQEIVAWTEYSNTYTASASPTTATILFEYIESAATSLTVFIDDVYLEHAADTDDEANGVYTFDDDPDAGSVNFTPIERYETLELANGSRVRFDPTGTGRGIAKYETTAEFTNAPKALYNNLVNLLAWQNSGNLLVFHPGGDYTIGTSPYIQRAGQRIHPVMYGYMELTPKSHQHWDLLNYVSFSFKFTEA